MLKKKSIFFQTFEEMADTIVEATEYFAKSVADLSDVTVFAKRMKEYENQCDRFTHTIIKELNKTFLPPIERDDIMSLTTSLDDVMDGIESCSARMEMYQIHKPTVENIVRFADIIVKSVHELRKAVYLLSNKKLMAMRPHAIAVNELENEGDDLLRVCIKNLFTHVTDPIELIKRKEIYELLEEVTDHCEDVANTLETIIMRNS